MEACRQCAVPMAIVHADRSDIDTMFASVADDLSRGIEAHWLSIE